MYLFCLFIAWTFLHLSDYSFAETEDAINIRAHMRKKKENFGIWNGKNCLVIGLSDSTCDKCILKIVQYVSTSCGLWCMECLLWIFVAMKFVIDLYFFFLWKKKKPFQILSNSTYMWYYLHECWYERRRKKSCMRHTQNQ